MISYTLTFEAFNLYHRIRLVRWSPGIPSVYRERLDLAMCRSFARYERRQGAK